MNGALNNVSMALELALGEAGDTSSEEMLRTGIAAIGQASRAAALLAHIVHGRGAPPDPDGAYARDVRDILREHARSTGGTLSADASAPVHGGEGVTEAAALLVAELARMQARAD
jgi:hypothetical protein